MRALQYITLILMTLSLSNTTYGQNRTERLQGKWGLEYNPSVAKMSSKLKQHFRSMPTAGQDQIRKAYQGRTYSFYGDGTYQQNQADGRSTTGNWSLNKKELQMIDKNGGVLKFRILSFTNSRLVIKAKENGQAKQFLSQWYLTKLKTN